MSIKQTYPNISNCKAKGEYGICNRRIKEKGVRLSMKEFGIEMCLYHLFEMKRNQQNYEKKS